MAEGFDSSSRDSTYPGCKVLVLAKDSFKLVEALSCMFEARQMGTELRQVVIETGLLLASRCVAVLRVLPVFEDSVFELLVACELSRRVRSAHEFDVVFGRRDGFGLEAMWVLEEEDAANAKERDHGLFFSQSESIRDF